MELETLQGPPRAAAARSFLIGSAYHNMTSHGVVAAQLFAKPRSSSSVRPRYSDTTFTWMRCPRAVQCLEPSHHINITLSVKVVDVTSFPGKAEVRLDSDGGQLPSG